MKLIKPSFEIIEQEPGLNGIYKAIERAGRTSYKSEDKITENSAKPFVDRMVNSGHGAVLEHGTVYLKISDTIENSYIIDKYVKNQYSLVRDSVDRYDCHGDLLFTSDKCITTNYRVLVENGWLDDLKYLCEPTEYHDKRITVKFICDRGVSHEFVRHRVFSFLQESTRYCNYSKDKFDNEITFIIPSWMDRIEEGEYSEDFDSIYDCIGTNLFDYDSFLIALAGSSKHYMRLLELGWKPQQARAVLPNALKTELVMTGFVFDWKHFFELRCASNAHPQAQELAIPLREEFIKRGYIVDNK